MSNTRHFDGARTTGKGPASQMMRLQIQKGGKVQMKSGDRYKQILAKKLEEHHKKSKLNPRNFFTLPGAKATEHTMSKKAETALKQVAQKKAAKEEKKMRQMVVVQPRHLNGVGRVDAKGRVFDVADNVVLNINTKDGKIRTFHGLKIGKYKPKSWMANQFLIDNVKKYSPYFIKVHQMQMLMQQQQLAQYYGAVGVPGPTLYGPPGFAYNVHGLTDNPEHNDYIQGQRISAGVTSLGVMSNNVHGTFAENTWGTMADNVWGTTYNNVWGGIGDPGIWGPRKSRRLWGSGNGKNHLKPAWAFVTGILGFRGRGNRGRGRTAAPSGRSR